MKEEILVIEGLTKSFNGNKVINGISFSVREGELSSIIGPNGAGKTTLFNLITGYHLPDSGRIVFNGKDLVGFQTYDIVRRGIARAFQRTNIFPRLSVLENVVATILTLWRKNMDMVTPTHKLKEAYKRAYQILESVGLQDMADQQGGTLAHGNQKRLDMAIALALEPKLLLLDEPTAGMSPEERWQTVELIHNLWKELSVTILFIEHDMDVVFKISQRVMVLCYGTLIAEGVPEEISRNDKVIEAYLGREE